MSQVERLHLEEMKEIKDEVMAYKTSCEEGIEKETTKGESLRHTLSEGTCVTHVLQNVPKNIYGMINEMMN